MKVILRLQVNTLISDLKLEPNSSITIGRTDKSNVKVPDPLISGIHCKINYQPPRLELVDMESKNGTYLNGIRVEQSDIFIGDEVKIGGTKITILTEKMDSNTINALTFPGQAKDRAAHSMQLDYAGAGIAPQGFAGLPGTEKKSPGSVNRETEERRQAPSKIKLTKKELKLRNKRASSRAKTFDTIFFIAALALPLLIMNFLLILSPAILKNNRLIVMLAGEILCGGIFYSANFKMLKFTLGEKVAGIQKLYENQKI